MYIYVYLILFIKFIKQKNKCMNEIDIMYILFNLIITQKKKQKNCILHKAVGTAMR